MIYIILAVIIFAADNFIKRYIDEKKDFGQTEEILNGKITINKSHNKGAILNFLEDKVNLLLVISGILLGFILIIFSQIIFKKENVIKKIGLSLILGGALSNTFDRITKGYVTDYFTIQYKKLKNIVFNISDFAIFIGSALWFVTSLLDREDL